MTLGQLIKEHRDAHSLSLQDVAIRCGISKGYVAMLERGINSKTNQPIRPSIEAISKICHGLNWDIDDVFSKLDDNYSVTIPSSYIQSSNSISQLYENIQSMSESQRKLLLIYSEFLLNRRDDDENT